MASILSAGTSSGTALNLTGDTSGILQLASNNGTVGLTMDTSQNIGIGTSSPSTYSNQKLVVYNNGIAAASGSGLTSGKFEVFSNGQTNNQITLSQGFATTDNIGYLYNRANAAFVFGTNNTEAMRIDSSGNVGIGTTATGTKLNVLLGTSYTIGGNWNSSVATFGQATSSGGIAGGALGVSFDTTNGATLSSLNPGVSWYQMQLAGTYIAFRTGGSATEAMRIDASGGVGIGLTNPTAGYNAKLAVTGGASRNIECISSGTSLYGQIGFTNGNGEVGYIGTSGTTTSYVTSSDYRLKENVAPMTDALAKVQALKPVTYKWKADGSDGEGFIAHELAEVCPHAVTGEKDAVDEEGKPVYQGIDTSFLVATLTAAIQEQQTIITDLKARIETLEKK